MKFFKGILFVQLCILVIGLIYWGFGQLLLWFADLSGFWLIVILVFFGGVIWRMFKMLSGVLMGFVSTISPSKILSSYTILILALTCCIWNIYKAWTMDVVYSKGVVFGTIVFTILVIELTIAFMFAGLIDVPTKTEEGE